MLTLTLHASAPDKKLLSPRALKTICAVLSHSMNLEKHECEATLAFVSSGAIQTLNHDFRGLKKPTNVLSFPQYSPVELKKITPSKKETTYLGDILLCKKVIVAEAIKQKKSLNHHLTHLIVHGVLHLLGYDHMKNAQARRMETLEMRILAELGIGNPYCDDPGSDGSFKRSKKNT